MLLFSYSVRSDSLQPQGLQHTRLPCPSPSPEVCPSSCSLHLWCHPAVSSSCPLLLLPSVFPSIRDFSNESAAHTRWPKYWSFSFSISPSNKYSGLISLKTSWFDLLSIQRTFRSLLQHHSSKASRCSAFFTVHISQLYMTTGKTIALAIQTIVGRIMSLVFNTLSRFVTVFLPRSNYLLIPRLQSLSEMILEPKKRKSVTTVTFPLLFAMKSWGQMPWS